MESIPSNLCELFAQSIQKFPDNLAVDHEDGKLTYRELDNASDALAHDLILLGVDNGSSVLLMTAHGSFNIIAILAILKAGACVVPIDRKSWSSEMVHYVCTTVSSRVIINTTTEPFMATSGSHHVLHLTSLPSTLPANDYYTSHNKASAPDAFIIFTSGSTGRPKGVIISHKSLCLYSKTSPLNLDMNPGDRLLHILSVAFDASACMLFSALGNGGTVVPTPAEDLYVKAPSCTVMAVTPSMLSNLPKVGSHNSIFSNIHTIILGGETASSDSLQSWVDAGVRVLIGYGATETTSMGSVHEVIRDPQSGNINASLIGCSTEQSPIWLVNSDHQLIEDELLEGEIFISGDGVSRGYYQDEINTNNNFTYWNSLRVYKTGDYGRWVRGPAGGRVLEFRGRKDRTVKNGGFLVNLDRDVEDALHRAGTSLGITSVCAALTEDGIIAVVTPESVDKTELLAKARQTMCSYCVPYRIEAVKSIPISPNGKVQLKEVLQIISFAASGDDFDSHTTTSSLPVAQVSDIETTEEEEKLSKILNAVSSLFGHSEGILREVKGSDSFPKLGGSSLLAFKLISTLRQLNLQIIPRDLFSCLTFEEIAKGATSAAFLNYKESPTQESSIVTQNLTSLRIQACDMLDLEEGCFDIGPLTSLQLVLAIPTLSCKSKNINQVKLTYSGAYAGMMERAWRAVWQAEPVFRTEICLMIGCGAQIIHKYPFRKPTMKSHSCLANYDKAVKDAETEVGLGCSLEFIVYSSATASSEATCASSKLNHITELTIVFTIHHSLMDGISLQILLSKIERAARGWPLSLSPSSIEANLKLISIQQNQDSAARKFFAEYLNEMHPKSSLLHDHNDTPKGDSGLAKQDNTVFFRSPVKSSEVTDFACQNHVSSACIYYTAWAMAMSSIERCSTVIIGSVFSNRAFQPEFENTIGLYISTLPLVVRLNDNVSIISLIRQVMNDIISVGEFAWASPDQIGIGGRIQSLVSLQPQLPGEKSNPPPVRVESLENSDFPLSLLIESTGEFRIVYDCCIFSEATVRRIGGHFKHALRGILHYTLVGECRRINELQEAAYKKSEMVKISRNEQTMKQILEASIDRFQDLVALEDCKGYSLTYGQLDEQTNLIASKINAYVANHNTTAIAIYGDGSAEWLLGILAIVKTSRAFVPIDPKWPMERKATVLDASGATAILIPDSMHRSQVPEITLKQIFVVKDLLSHKSGEQKAERLPDCGSADSVLTYIFTSGTTGVPKGIPTTNRSFLALQSNPEATMFAAPGRRIAQFMSPAFDVCNQEIFSALLHGATLVLRDPEDPYAHLSKVNTATMTPTVLSVLEPDEFPNIEIIYSTGEPMTSVIVQKFATKKLIYNAYGPAECAVYALFERMILGDELTIGTTSETVRVYIFDEEQNLLPPGVQGEIYLAGVQVLQEYINAPEQTALRIYPDPLYPAERMYRTGDYGICEKDNRITCIGRIDRQVKIRGFRVELDSVEQSILSKPAIDKICQCSVIAIDGALVAYIRFNLDESQSHSSVEERINQLRDRLEKTLLPSWVPQLFISLGNFPKSANGKVDSKALEKMYRSRAPLRDEPIHRSPMQTTNSSVTCRLAEAWREILQLKQDVQLESTDNFFRLGGHSVLAMLLATKLTSIFEVKVTPRELLPAPAFQDQINVIEQLLNAKEANTYYEKSESDVKIVTRGENALSVEVLTELEKQVWLQYQVAETVTAFNIANILTISGQVDYPKLIYSFNAALASDPVLSCNFTERPDGLRRTIRGSPPRICEVSQLDIAAEINFPFNLEQDALIRLHVIRQLGEKEMEQQKSAIQIVIVTSHSIADLATVQNLLRIVSAVYAGQNIVIHKEPQHLSSCRWRYSPSLTEKHFWRSYLKGYDAGRSRSSYFQLPLLPSTMATFQGSSRTREFHGHTISTLNSLIKRLGITHHQMALAMAALLLQWLVDEDDIILGAPNASRPTLVEQDALGQFLDRLPIRIRLESSSSAKAELKLTRILTDVRDSALQALANAIPFSNILESLDIPSGSLTHPIFDCMVTFHPSSASLDKWLQLPLCQVAASPLFAKGSKFPLMLEWFELDSDRWSLHIEHDTRRLPSHVSNKIEVGLQTILEAMADECSLFELHSRLDTSIQGNGSSVDSQLKAEMYTDMQSRLPPLSVTEVIDIVRSEMASCLGVDGTKISPETSFFSSGANSKSAVTLRHRLRIIGLEVSLRAIFTARSPMELISHITV